MGNVSGQTRYVNYNNMHDFIKNKNIIINTMPLDMQSCLIKGTISIDDEVEIINRYMKMEQWDVLIVLYGKNDQDISVREKCNQLLNLQFKNVYMYMGGMFEWLLLQEMFGEECFPTTVQEYDVLKYKQEYVKLVD